VDKTVNVLVIAREAVVLEAVRALCERTRDLSLAGAYSSVDEALGTQTPADVILLDLKEPDIEHGAIEGLRAEMNAPLLALVDRDQEGLARRIESQGGSCLRKSAPIHRIVRAIRLVSRGQRVSPEDEHETPSALTPRERQVLELLSLGRTNRDIAGELAISARTVATHVSTIYRKLGVSDRVEAARRGMEMGPGSYPPST
jgi:DNA-binding NarL/FixJ family response regulator